MAYHISYEKTKTYEMPENIYKEVSTWEKDVLKSYKDMRAYSKKPEASYRIQPASMKGRHQDLLNDALSYRLKNKDKPSNGSKIFSDVIGEYTITIDDMAVIEKRMKVLGEILDILNGDLQLTTQDPNPSGRALGEEEVIVLEKVTLESAIREALLVMAYRQQGKMKVGGVMGYLNKNYPQFKKDMAKISTIVQKDIAEVSNLFNTEGLENLQKL